MRTITILYDGTAYTYKWIKALLWAKNELNSHGYHVELSSLLDYFPLPYNYNNCLLDSRLKVACKRKYDILFLAFHHSKNEICKDKIKRINLLKKLRENTSLLCWLDTADSTGSCLFDVLPYVDLYFKKQILRDRTLYTRKVYCNRIFAEYYHNLYNISDPINDVDTEILPLDQLHKLRVAWNITYYDYLGGKLDYMLHPSKLSTTPLNKSEIKSRYYDIYYNGSNPSVYGPVIGFQRKYVLDYINRQESVTHPDAYKKISRMDYLRDLDNSKAIASPFGWGECCLRDMEAFIHGCILIKPSMEHCETYPNIYKPSITYVPINWDFSNFDDIINNIKNGEYYNIAKNGQNLYDYYMSIDGRREFAEHIIKQLTF